MTPPDGAWVRHVQEYIVNRDRDTNLAGTFQMSVHEERSAKPVVSSKCFSFSRMGEGETLTDDHVAFTDCSPEQPVTQRDPPTQRAADSLAAPKTPLRARCIRFAPPELWNDEAAQACWRLKYVPKQWRPHKPDVMRSGHRTSECAAALTTPVGRQAEPSGVAGTSREHRDAHMPAAVLNGPTAPGSVVS
jgi:hypothetical protein